MKKAILLLCATLSFGASSSIITFDDRQEFADFVYTYNVDGLSGLASGAITSADRSAYNIAMNAYGCTTRNGACGSNTRFGISNEYIYAFEAGTFSFDSAINAFGLDYTFAPTTSSFVSLNGYQSTISNGGFWGIVDTSGYFTNVAFDFGAVNPNFDNVSYGTSELVNANRVVPANEPGTFAAMAMAMFLLISRSISKKTSKSR